MSLKENVEYIKEEINTQESFLESFFKIEKFTKKYKKPLIGFSIAIVVGLIGFNINSYIKEQNKLEANSLLNKVLENPKDTKAIEQLKTKDKTLYEIAKYISDNKNSVNIEFLKELATYNKAVASNDEVTISKATASQKFLLKDYALFNQALIEAQKGEYSKAKETLALIPVTSQVKKLSKLLEHFLITK